MTKKRSIARELTVASESGLGAFLSTASSSSLSSLSDSSGTTTSDTTLPPETSDTTVGNQELFRLAMHVHRLGRELSDAEMLGLVRAKFPGVAECDVEDVASQLEDLLGRIEPRKQELTTALARADAAADPPEAARYGRRPQLRRLIRLIQQLPRDEHGAVTLAQQPIADLFGIKQQFVSRMIRKLTADGLLKLHTPASRKDRRAATYIWRST